MSFGNHSCSDSKVLFHLDCVRENFPDHLDQVDPRGEGRNQPPYPCRAPDGGEPSLFLSPAPRPPPGGKTVISAVSCRARREGKGEFQSLSTDGEGSPLLAGVASSSLFFSLRSNLLTTTSYNFLLDLSWQDGKTKLEANQEQSRHISYNSKEVWNDFGEVWKKD